MIKIRILAIMLLSALFLHTSCQKNELEITDNNKENRIETIANDGLIKLGKKLENPYSVTNMKRAYNSLLSKNEIKSNSKEEAITNTHLYVRFLPKDSLENNILINDTTLELFTYHSIMKL